MKNQESVVYKTLREKILTLELKPGQELNVNQVAEEMNVSRSPIRDALLRLSLDNLVDIYPQKGTRVSFLDKEIIEQERFFRITTELGVLHLFMKQLDEAHQKIYAAKLKAILLEQHASLLSGDKKLFMEEDDALHKFFYSETNNNWLWNVVASNTGNDYRIRILSYDVERISMFVEKEHAALVNAIEEGNSQEVFAIDEKHMRNLESLLPKMIGAYPEYFNKKL